MVASERVEAAGFLLFTREPPKRFLLMKHKSRWDLPKGHAEKGETPLEAALRETEEETGIAAQSIEIDTNFRFVLEYEVTKKKRGTYKKRVTYFVGMIESAVDVTLTEHVGYQWTQWPATDSIQSETIDPLLTAVAKHFAAQA